MKYLSVILVIAVLGLSSCQKEEIFVEVPVGNNGTMPVVLDGSTTPIYNGIAIVDSHIAYNTTEYPPQSEAGGDLQSISAFVVVSFNGATQPGQIFVQKAQIWQMNAKIDFGTPIYINFETQWVYTYNVMEGLWTKQPEFVATGWSEIH